jgi:hypothetical protein
MKRRSETVRAGRLGLAGLAIVAVAALAGCGVGGNSTNNAFNDSFNASFDKSTHDSCLKSAEGQGAMATLAETYCTCVVGQLDKLTVAQKMGLNGNSPELQQAATACKPGAPADASNDATIPAAPEPAAPANAAE